MKALFINRDDLIKNTFLDGNLDGDKFIQYIHQAQIIHVRNFLGLKLYDKISADILASTLSGNYLTLVNDYIKPMLIHYSLVEYLPYSSYSLKNGGIYKHTSENSETASTEDVQTLIAKERDVAEYYARVFVDYMCDNSQLFPEYNQSSNISPDRNINYTNWNI